MKALAAVFLAGALLFPLAAGCGEDSTSAEEPTPAKSPTTESASPPASPQQRVRDALGDEVAAGGYAGDLAIRDVTFDSGFVEVTATTPEGGLEGASCGDLDDGAQAVFETIYNDGGWKGETELTYKGGLVDSATGEELRNDETGSYTMPAAQAKQIDWADEDVLLNIDWENYQDFCHPALHVEEG